MAESKIDIIITTIKKGLGDKETKRTLKELGEGFKDVTGISLGWAGVIGTVSAGLVKFKQVADQSISDVTSLANSTEHLMRITGDNAKETSRFIQMADDARIEVGDLEAALQLAANKGIAVNTKALMTMSDEYNKLAPGVERNTFVAEKFGKQSKEITKLLEMGSAEIKARMLTTSNSITVDNAAVASSKEYQQSLDSLSDAALGLRMTLGKDLIPQLADIAVVTADVIAKSEGFIKSWSTLSRVMAGFQSLGLSEVIRAGSNSISDQADKIRADEEATRGAIIAQQIFIQDARTNYDVLDTGLNPAVDSAARQYGSLAIKAGDADGAIEGVTNKTLPAADAMKTYSKELLFAKVAESLTEDAALRLAYQMGLVDNATVTASQKQKEYKQMLDTGKISVDEYTTLIAGLSRTIGDMQSKEVDVTVNHYENWFERNYNGGGDTRNGASVVARAAGGPVYPGQVAMVGEKGPEPVVFGTPTMVYPTGSNVGGNVVNITVNGAGDARSVANEVMRQLRLQGIAR